MPAPAPAGASPCPKDRSSWSALACRSRTRARTADGRPAALKKLQDFIQLLQFEAAELAENGLDLLLRRDIALVIVHRLFAVALGLAVLAHQDQRRAVGRLGRHEQVEQDERIGIPLIPLEQPYRVDDHPDDED